MAHHPKPEDQVIVLVDRERLIKAENLIQSCEACDAGAQLPFESILDSFTETDASVTEYLCEMPAKCPRCRRDITVKTFVRPVT
jgi:hypothetical protein